MTKICFYCKEEKDISQFSKSGKHPSGRTKYKPFCKTCESYYPMKRKLDMLMKAYGKPFVCEHCGYDKNFSALEFHHLDPNEKEFSLKGCTNYSYERAKKEVDKCILLCANCHRELHNPGYNEKYHLNGAT